MKNRDTEIDHQLNTIELGRKIKETRLRKKLTQSEVVGDYITRNMLSQIESGIATPSMKTLSYLANVLDIPMSQLVSNEVSDNKPVPDSLSETQHLNFYLLGRSQYADGNYQLAISTLEQLQISTNPFFDETSALLAEAYYQQAKLVSKSDSTLSLEYIRKAITLSSSGLFANAALKTEALMLLNSLL